MPSKPTREPFIKRCPGLRWALIRKVACYRRRQGREHDALWTNKLMNCLHAAMLSNVTLLHYREARLMAGGDR